jgi:hypothetical protein
LENDTGLVSAYYKDGINLARDSGHYLRADAILLREAPVTYIAGRIGIAVPSQYALAQNFPNPFNPTTEIRFGIPARTIVDLVVYDILGREVIGLINHEVKDAGEYTIKWDSKENASHAVKFKNTLGITYENRKHNNGLHCIGDGDGSIGTVASATN